ncbi:MAG: class I SAM-dependent methyltransferase [Syntrophomonadaceae bacterium]|nr:class I SAM-dependent methyltransferase [Syntrophomonadaceae bacterium]
MDINAAEFDRMAREVFAPVYPVLAEQIISQFGISRGTCLDIGCGGGYMGLALAQITELETILFDESQDMLKLAQGYILQSGLEARVKTLPGDVHDIPLADESVNLAVSRGSMFFWKDRVKAFREIYRVLALGGVAMIGGGFGNTDLLREIEEKMHNIDPEWKEKRRQRIGQTKVQEYRAELEQAGIPTFEIRQDETGLWIVIRRTA